MHAPHVSHTTHTMSSTSSTLDTRAFPGAIVMWLEWWSFEGFSLFVGLLQEPDIALAAHGTMFNILVVIMARSIDRTINQSVDQLTQRSIERSVMIDTQFFFGRPKNCLDVQNFF